MIRLEYALMNTGESKRIKRRAPLARRRVRAADRRPLDRRLHGSDTPCGQDFGRDAVICAAPTESGGFCSNQFNLSIEFFRLNGVDNRLRLVRRREQNRDRNLSCHIISRTNRCALRPGEISPTTKLRSPMRFSIRTTGSASFLSTTRIMPAHIERRLHLRLGDAPIFESSRKPAAPAA